jgi:hypothetical protein
MMNQQAASNQKNQMPADMNQFSNYAAMMAAMNPAALAANPNANPFFQYQQMLANPLFAQFVAMAAANPAAAGMDYNWMRNAAPSIPQSQDPASQRMYQQSSGSGQSAKKMSNYPPQNVKKHPANTKYTQVSGLKVNSSSNARKPASSSVYPPSTMNPQYRSFTVEANPDLFKQHMSLEKRRGLKPCSLHVALARSIARSRSLLVSEEPLSRGNVYKSAVNKNSLSNQNEDGASAAESEKTEEEGNIDDLAAAATLASVFAPNNSQEETYEEEISLNRKRSSQVMGEDLNNQGNDEDVKRIRHDESNENEDILENLVGQRICFCLKGNSDWRKGMLLGFNEELSAYEVQLDSGVKESLTYSTIQLKSL